MFTWGVSRTRFSSPTWLCRQDFISNSNSNFQIFFACLPMIICKNVWLWNHSILPVWNSMASNYSALQERIIKVLLKVCVFQPPERHFKNQPPHSFQPNYSGRWLAEIGIIQEDALPRMAKYGKMTWREWLNPVRWLTEIGQIPAYNKPESQKRIWWNQHPKAIFRALAILACRKPKLRRIFKFTEKRR